MVGVGSSAHIKESTCSATINWICQDAQGEAYYIGGIIGVNDYGIVLSNSFSGRIYNKTPETDDRTFAPSIGGIVGAKRDGTCADNTIITIDSNGNSINYLRESNLKLVTWKGGFLWTVTYSFDQRQYVSNSVIGREL